MKKIELFKKLANFDQDGVSRVVAVKEFVDDYISLSLGNGGSWCRFDSLFAKEYKIVTVKKNGIRYSWNVSDDEKLQIVKDFNHLDKKGNSILYIKSYGKQCDIENTNRHISLAIKNRLKGESCVVCGSNNDTIIDHKNHLYNDSRVLNISTQKLTDFQVLCNHCNLQKRQVTIIMKSSKKKILCLKYSLIKATKYCFY